MPTTNEQAPVQTPAQISYFPGLTPEKNGHAKAQPEMPRERRLLSLARKLRDNETVLALMRNAFRMFQRIGITVSPNHYYWPVPDFRELESREWPAEQDPVGLDLGLDRQLDFLQTVVPRYQIEW